MKGIDPMSFTISDVTTGSIIIAPAHMHSALRLQLLEHQNGTLGITLLSLQAFLHRYQTEEIDQMDVLLQYRSILSNAASTVYQNLLPTLDFVTQCYEFIEEMKLYGIAIDELPQTSVAQKEMKLLLSLLYPIRTPQDVENEALTALSNTTLASLYVMDAIWSSKDCFRIEVLFQHGANRLVQPHHNPSITYYHSINKRKEVEAAAQMIVKEERLAQGLNIIVTDTSYQPLIKQIFSRYHIPFTIMKQTKTNSLTTRFQKLLAYACTPSTQLLIELVELNTFACPHLNDLIEYMTIFGKALSDPFDHIRTKAQPSQLIEEGEIKQLTRLEANAQEVKEYIVPLLEPIASLQDPQELLTYLHDLVCTTVDANNLGTVRVLKQIQDVLVSYLPYISSRDDLPFLIELLDTIKESANGASLHGALITKLQAPLPARHTCMMFGCTQKLYPAFPAKKGLFDEAYVKLIPSYPSMTKRSNTYRTQLEASFSAYKELIISYPIGGYDGKANEGALEMEQYLNQSSTYKEPDQTYIPLRLSKEISEKQANQLFLRDGTLFGSISAFEKYIRCPFSYFLTYGLKLREPIDYSFSQSRIGTLSHYILETLVSRYGKAYPSAPLEELQDIIHEELTKMAQVYPLFAPQIPLLERRMIHSLKKNMEILTEIEEHSSLAPFKCEDEFWWELPLTDDRKLCLHGFIDRLDASQGYLRIIDYKSSIKALSEPDVFTGLQLQLVTYALYAKEQYQKDVLGVFYYSLKNENIPAIAGKMTRRPVTYVPLGKEDYDAMRLKTKQLRGWIMNEAIDVIDDDGSHILGVRQNKDGAIKARNIYDLSVLDSLFKQMYDNIGSNIISGHIACEPTEDACMFCPYHEICRFQGYPRVLEPLVDTEEIELYLGGE